MEPYDVEHGELLRDRVDRVIADAKYSAWRLRESEQAENYKFVPIDMTAMVLYHKDVL